MEYMTDLINLPNKEELVDTVEHCLGLSANDSREVQAKLMEANGEPRFYHFCPRPDAARAARLIDSWLRQKGNTGTDHIVGPYGKTEEDVGGVALWRISVEQVASD